MRIISAFIVVLASFFTMTKALAVQAVPLPYSDPVEVSSGAEFLKDSTGQLSLSDVMALNTWAPSDSRLLNFGITNSAIWVRFSIDTAKAKRGIYLTSDYPGIDDLQAFIVYHNEENEPSDTLESAPIVQGGAVASRAAFSIKLKKNVRTSVYVRAASTGPIILPMRLISFNEAVESQARFSWEQALTGALMIIILFQSAIMWALDRYSFYLYSIMTVLSLIWIGVFYGVFEPMTARADIDAALLWRIGVFSLFMAVLTAIAFVRGVFFSQIRTRIGLQCYRLIMVSTIVLAIGSFWMDLDVSLVAINVFGIGVSLVAIGMLKTVVRQRKLPASMAIPAFLVMMFAFGMAHAVALEYPWIGDELWMVHSTLFGILIQVAVVGVVAFYRVIAQQRRLYATHAKLYQAEKLHALGDLASGIVTNIKAPLYEIDDVFKRFSDGENVNRLSAEGVYLSQKILSYLKSLYVFAYPSRFDERDKLLLHDIIEEARTLGLSNNDEIALVNEVDEGIEISGSRTFLTLGFLHIVSWFVEKLQLPESGGKAEILFTARKDMLSEITEIRVTGAPGIQWTAELESELEDSATTVKKLSISKRILRDHRGNLSINYDSNGNVIVKAIYI